MLGETFRLIAVAKLFQPGKVGAIERLPRTDVEPDAMQRERVMFPQKSQLRMGGTPAAHIIFGMDLEKAERLRRGGNGGEMLGLKARAGAQGKLRNAHGFFSLTRLRTRISLTQKRGARMPRAPVAHQDPGLREPMPFGVFIFSHVPFGTYFQ